MDTDTEQATEESDYGYEAGYDAASSDEGAAGADEGSAGGGPPSVALGGLMLHPESAHGTHVVKVGVHLYNMGGPPIAEGDLTLWIRAEPYSTETGKEEDNAEQGAFLSTHVPALGPKDTFPFQMPIQLDPGHWHFTVTVWSRSSESPLATAEGDVVAQGHHARQVDYDEHVKRELGVVVTHMTRVDDSLYQVHFILNNLGNAPVPAGLPVVGILTSEVSGMSSSQQYDLPAPIAGAASVQTYLTLEGAAAGTLTATIMIDPYGPSRQEDSLVVQAEKVQAPSPSHGTATHPSAGAAHADSGQGGLTSDNAKEAGFDVDDDRTAALHDEEEFKRRMDAILTAEHGALTVAEIAGFFAKEGSAFAEISEFALGPAGDILMLVSLFSAVIEAFGEEAKGLKGQGFLFGLVWEVLGHPTVEPQLDQGPYAGLGMLSPDERKEAFLEGAAEGRATASSDPKVHNAIAARIAYKMVHDGQGEDIAANLVLNEIAQARGITKFLYIDIPTV